MSMVQIDPWPAGGIVHESIEPGHRALKAISFLRENETDNAYAKPITGVISHVDLTLQKVTHIEDHGVVEMPKAHARYDADSQPKLREQPKKIDITQPDGPGFEVEGNLISWEGWQVRASVNPDEGPVLHHRQAHICGARGHKHRIHRVVAVLPTDGIRVVRRQVRPRVDLNYFGICISSSSNSNWYNSSSSNKSSGRFITNLFSHRAGEWR